MLTFKGELAEDSLDVPPSYIPVFMSADIMYGLPVLSLYPVDILFVCLDLSQ